MNILQIHNLYQKAGGEDYVVNAEKDLLETNGNKVVKLTVNNNNIKKIYSERKQFYRKLEVVLDENKFDVAHIHNIYHVIGSRVYKKLYKAGIPIIQTLHNYRLLCPNGLFFDNKNQICELCSEGGFKYSVYKRCYQKSFIKSFLMQKLVKKQKKESLKYVSKFIVLTEFSKKKFSSIVNYKDHIVVKPNFVTNISKEFVSKGEYALYIGRVSNEKGITTLIQAFKNIDFDLKIAGTGDCFETYKKEAYGADNIEFCGFVSGKEKVELLKNASFLIFPSLWYETFGLTIIEAFQNGKCVIASDLGGTSEIVNDGVNGFLFKAGDKVSLQEKVNKIINNNLFESMGKNAFKSFNEKYSEEINYNQLIDIYNSVINEESKMRE